jgi:hypothetical protein
MNTRLEQFKKTKLYEGEFTVKELYDDIESIAQLDDRAEILKSRWEKTFGVACTGLFGSFFILAIIGDVGYVLTAISVALGVLSGVKSFTTGKFDTEDRRYEFVKGTIKLIAGDLEETTPLSLRMNLDKPNRRDTEDGKGEANGWKVKYYRDPWLDLQGRFADGTKFQLLALEKYQYRTRWARSSSGKTKRKTKSKTATEFMVNLRPKSRRYPQLENLADKAQGAVKLPRGMIMKNIALSENRASLRTNVKEQWHGTHASSDAMPGNLDASHGVAAMFLSLYQILNLAKETAKRTTST